MKTQVLEKDPKLTGLVPQYEWRDRFKNMHTIESMETRHLFHVVRMVWDHSMPEKFQTSFKNRYRFPAFYTEEYMALTIRLMLPALLHRKDLTIEQHYWLQFMRHCLIKDNPQIPFILKIGFQDVAS